MIQALIQDPRVLRNLGPPQPAVARQDLNYGYMPPAAGGLLHVINNPDPIALGPAGRAAAAGAAGVAAPDGALFVMPGMGELLGAMNPAEFAHAARIVHADSSQTQILNAIKEVLIRLPLDAADNPAVTMALLRLLISGNPAFYRALNIDVPEGPIAGRSHRFITDLLNNIPENVHRRVMGRPYYVQGANFKRSKAPLLPDAINKRRNIPFPDLQFKDGAKLQAFPQWGVQMGKKVKKANDATERNYTKAQALTNRDDLLLTSLHAMDPYQAVFNQATGVWQGKYAQRVQKRLVNNDVKVRQKTSAANEMLKTRITEDQVAKEVPAVVAKIVKANQNLSKTGFGPVKDGGSDLYAGRWVDTQTGNVRMLPTANQKYLNPASLQQKLAYLQAKILNHWNSLLNTQAQYDKFNAMGPIKYRQKALNRIKGGFDVGLNLLTQAKSINDKIIAYRVSRADELPLTTQQALIARIPPDRVNAIYNMAPPRLLDQIKAMDPLPPGALNQIQNKCAVWERELVEAVRQAEQAILADDDLNNVEIANLNAQMNRAYLDLISGPSRKTARAFQSLEKVAFIPDDINPRDLIATAERLQEAKEATKRSIQQYTGSLNSLQMDRLKGMGVQLKNSGQNYKALVPAIRQEAYNVLFQGKPNIRVRDKAVRPSLQEMRRRIFP